MRTARDVLEDLGLEVETIEWYLAETSRILGMDVEWLPYDVLRDTIKTIMARKPD